MNNHHNPPPHSGYGHRHSPQQQQQQQAHGPFGHQHPHGQMQPPQQSQRPQPMYPPGQPYQYSPGPPSTPTILHQSGENPSYALSSSSVPLAHQPFPSSLPPPAPVPSIPPPSPPPAHASGSISSVKPPPAAPTAPAGASPSKVTPAAGGEPPVGFRFRITHPDGRVETMLVDAERALIGSAAHCEVRLEPDLVAHEHIEVFANEKKIHFALRAYGLGAAVPLLDGSSLSEGAWPKGSVLSIAGTQLTVELVDLATPRAKPPYAVILAAVMILATVAATVYWARPPAHAEIPIPPAPQLIPPKEAATCPNAAPDQRMGLANEKNRIALAHRERSPFSALDGFDAIAFFETAAVCYRLAGAQNEAREADEAANALRAKLDDEYRVRRVRLEHAYNIHDLMAMKRELMVLIPMTSRVRSPYTDWLAALDRQVSADLQQVGRLGGGGR